MNVMENRIIRRIIAQFGLEEAKRVASGLVAAAEAAEETKLAREDAMLLTWRNYVDLHFGRGAAVKDGGLLIEMLSYFEKLTKGQHNKEIQAKLRELGIKAKGKGQ